MKAAIRRTYGSPQQIQIENIATPSLGNDEVLVRVHATTVNRTDCANLTAQPFIMRFVLGFFRPRKVILGTDFAGEVVATGKDVNLFNVKDRVFGFTDTGLASQAEYMALKPKGNVLAIPEGIDYKCAAASLEGAHYAYSFLHKVTMQPQQNVLVNGATGGIGSALLQFLKQFKVHITATCRTKDIALIKSLGADKVYDYTKEDFTKGNETYDFIFDTVGKSTFGKCKPLLKRGGVYISSELGPYAQNVFLAMFTSARSSKRVVFPIPYGVQKTLPYIHDLLEKGTFHPLIDREYALDNISDAYEYVISGEKTGNVIINV
ncbi:NAD(P)-dependent alcohol dehydrogenase [Pontibacter mangrovi]|uniref:NAD(P)-dependent alcohol dehydrogenase n=2 Tax=Pontibacter mangrovi TaxID=2589816 RepID=A0A501W6J4_9BACT|nr:NAD(P)-dependent alcohol dehydrogenase [Pontibacter mangrovi]